MMGEPMTATRLTAYAAVLEKTPFGAVVIGLEKAAEECRYFPKPVEVRDLGICSREWAHAKALDAELTAQRYLPEPMTTEQRLENIDRLRRLIQTVLPRRVMR